MPFLVTSAVRRLPTIPDPIRLFPTKSPISTTHYDYGLVTSWRTGFGGALDTGEGTPPKIRLRPPPT
ncbi:hypothetical protein BDV26DRAFT_122175 [Aspergillus bertholletiae]|uniref:Uncharacterized protein n=1 Tax=Aspergillus bertholletiae TaxID=1226010 RepID=A0A5N7ARJ4_9EURO|nr:hypothetical protein BDV26DRAFT_122175 [Aspergillus bertholletiae]